MKDLPTQDQADLLSSSIKKRVQQSFPGTMNRLQEMTFEEKRGLLQLIFSSNGKAGNRSGIYLERINNAWQFSIKGSFTNIIEGKIVETKGGFKISGPALIFSVIMEGHNI